MTGRIYDGSSRSCCTEFSRPTITRPFNDAIQCKFYCRYTGWNFVLCYSDEEKFNIEVIKNLMNVALPLCARCTKFHLLSGK